MRAYWTTTRILLMGYTIDVQTAQQAPVMGPRHDLTVAVRAAITGGPGEYHVEPEAIIDVLSEYPDVENIQIKDGRGNAIVVAFARL